MKSFVHDFRLITCYSGAYHHTSEPLNNNEIIYQMKRNEVYMPYNASQKIVQSDSRYCS